MTFDMIFFLQEELSRVYNIHVTLCEVTCYPLNALVSVCIKSSHKVVSAIFGVDDIQHTFDPIIFFLGQDICQVNTVWSLTKFYSVDFSQSRIGVKKSVFNEGTIKVCVNCN